MRTPGQNRAINDVLAKESPDIPRLNLADNHEVVMICAALNCRLTDIYVAVSMVGDQVHDIRRYLAKSLAQGQESRRAISAARAPTSLPPMWP